MGEFQKPPEPSPHNPEAVEGRKALYGRLSAAWHHAKEGIPIPGWVALDVDDETISLKPKDASDQFLLSHTRGPQGVNGVSVVHIFEPEDTANGFEQRLVNFSARIDGYDSGPGTIVTRPFVWDGEAGEYVALDMAVQAFSMNNPRELSRLSGSIPRIQTHDWNNS